LGCDAISQVPATPKECEASVGCDRQLAGWVVGVGICQVGIPYHPLVYGGVGRANVRFRLGGLLVGEGG